MARKGKAKAAARARSKAKAERKQARKEGRMADVRQLSKEMRKQGDIMRKASGREKGQRTTYTGPAQESTIDKILADTGDTLSKTGTKWQQVNKAWLNDLMEKHNISLVQARSKLKTIFSNNRERFLEEQQQRYDDNIVAPVLDTKLEELDLGDKGKGKVVPKITGGSEYLATDYDRPVFQDWSDLEPPNMPGLLGSAKAQQDLLGSGMAAYQPWAQPATPYQPPVGPTYATRASLLGSSPAEAAAAVANNQQNNQQQSGTFMGQNYANQGENMMLLDTHNKAMQLIRGGHNQGMGIGELMGKSGWVNDQYSQLGGTDAIVGGGSFGNYIAPPEETAPLYYGDATANPHLTNTYDTSRTGTMNIFQGGQDYDAPLIFDPTATAEYTGGLLGTGGNIY